MNKPLRWAARTIAGVLLVTLSILFMIMLVSTAPQAETSEDGRAPRSVIVIESTFEEVRRQFDGYGVADALHHADVPARVTSTVTELPATSRAGNPIAAGQLIVQLDDSDFLHQRTITNQQIADIESQLASLMLEQRASDDRLELSREEVEIANRDFERIQEAAKRDAAPPREVDQMRQSLIAKQSALITARQQSDQLQTRRSQLLARQASEEASLRLAQQQIDRCRITSPLDGFIESVDVKMGESLMSGARVARVVDPTSIEVPLRLSAAVRSELGIGDTVNLHATGTNKNVWQGRV
ncbi:MAG: HlyD family efflux transporter periplasmic adaptor subunit, partial [Phycisphaerales bacterium]|nr:HlyD family efflux transporter periplasmic adaptor subunit [Phycisphaerales bacterium]